MGIDRVSGQKTGAVAIGQVASLAKAFPGNVTAGNLIVIGSGSYLSRITATSCTDGLSNSYTRAVNALNTDQYGQSCIFYAMNVTGGACTVTITPSSSDYLNISLQEYSGALTTGVLDVTATGFGTSTTPATGNLVTTNTDAIFGHLVNEGATATLTENASYTLVAEVEDGTNLAFNACDRIVASGTYTVSWTMGSSQIWVAAGASFKPAAGGTLTEKTVTDGIYMTDTPSKTLSAKKLDASFVSDTYMKSKIANWSFSDGLQITDTPGKTQEAKKVDQVMTSEFTTKMLSQLYLDRLLLGENLFNQLLKIIIDRIFVGDTSIRSKSISTLLADGLFLNDFMAKTIQRILLDNNLLSDSEIKLLYKVLIDKMLLSDTVNKAINRIVSEVVLLDDTIKRSILKAFSDGLLTSDTEQKDTSRIKIIIDGLLVSDSLKKELTQIFSDKIFLGEVISTSLAKLIQSSIADGIVLNDIIRKSTLTIFTDSPLLVDSIKKDLHKIFTDMPLLGDNVITLLSALIQALITDGILLDDRQVKQIEKKNLDNLFLGDTYSTSLAQLILKVITDTVFINDIYRKMQTGLVIDNVLVVDGQVIDLTKVLTDKLITSDFLLRQLLQIVDKDNIVFDDTELRTIIRNIITTDIIVMLDLQQKVVDMKPLDIILLSEYSTKLLTQILGDSLLIGDTDIKLIIEAVVAYLVWARLTIQDYLGISIKDVDLLGRKLQSVDYLNTQVSWNRTEVQL